MELSNRVILITGSGDRVGKAIALALARKGAQIVIHYHTRREKARQAAEEIAAAGLPPLVVQGDVSRREDWERMSAEILAKFGKIDGLVNNAALFYRTPLGDISEEQWDQFMNVNLKGVFWGCRTVGEQMLRQQRGRIVNIADVAARQVWTEYLPYSVSKAGVLALTRGLARKFAPHVTVNAIVPGMIMPAESLGEEEREALIRKIPLQRSGSANDLANAVLYLFEGGDFITGAEITIDGGRTIG